MKRYRGYDSSWMMWHPDVKENFKPGWETLLSVAIIIFIASAIFGAAGFYIRNSDPLKSVQGWKVYKITDPKTSVWSVARVVAANHYDTQGIVYLIAKENHLGKNYDLQYRNEISVPIMAKK